MCDTARGYAERRARNLFFSPTPEDTPHPGSAGSLIRDRLRLRESAMWTTIILVCSGVGLLVTLLQFRLVRDYPTRLLILVMWARFSIAALHEFTAKPLGAGLSISALATIGFTGLLLLACRGRDFRAPHFALYVPMLVIIGISAVLNMQVKGLINELIAWGLFLAVIQVTTLTIAANGMDRTMKAVMASLLTPVLLQLASIAVGKSIGSELDGSRGFIGGYIHEAVFSRVLMIFLVVIVLVRWRSALMRMGLMLYAVAAIFVTNYRTTIIAVLPIAAVVMGAAFLAAFTARWRPVVVGVGALTVIIGATVALPLLPERYTEIFLAVSKIGDLIQEPIAFTDAEKRIFSHRFYIWSSYVSDYLDGNPAQRLFGIGPFSDQGKFIVAHAHSSYINYLYEYGLFGFFYLIFMLIYNAIYCMRVSDLGQRATLLSLHAGFVILNLTTGAMKSIEGLLVYALIMAATLSWARSPTRGGRTAAARPGG